MQNFCLFDVEIEYGKIEVKFKPFCLKVYIFSSYKTTVFLDIAWINKGMHMSPKYALKRF